MSADNLPDNVSTADFDRAFPPDCPDACASMRSCPDKCGGCSCHLSPPCSHCTEHIPCECDCPTKEEREADRAEAMADAAKDADVD